MPCAMTALRPVSLPVHGALELLVGLATMAAPFALGFSPAGSMLAVVAGALIVGLSLGAVAPDGPRPALPVATHHAFDYALASGLLGAAVLLGLAGDRTASAYLTTAGLAQLALNVSTRYSRR